MRIAEAVSLPIMVCQDGFITSHAIENIELVETEKVREFVGEYKPAHYLLNKDATAKWGYSLFGHDVYVSQSMPDMAAGKRAVLYLDPTGLAVKVAENPSVQVLREKFADEHAVGVICWMEVDSKVENKQKIAVLDMKAAVTPGG